MKRTWKLALASAVCFVSVGTATSRASVLLSTLLSGGSISQGNATYNNFTWGDSGKGPATSNIVVDATTNGLGQSVLTFSLTSGTWSISQDSSIIGFNATFATPVNNIGLSFIATGTVNGVASVGETATDVTHSIDYSLQVVMDGAGPLADAFTASKPLSLSTTSILVHPKSIDVAGTDVNASITSVSNVFTPVPEPASLAILALSVPLFARRSRRRQA